jgi:preprotein translocase subunit SecE
MKLINYIKETKAEMKHVSWPTKRQAITYTILVVIVSALTAAYLGAFDAIFEEIVSKTF